MKIIIPKVFQQTGSEQRDKRRKHASSSPVRVLSSVPKPLSERNVRMLPLLDSQPKERFLNYEQRFYVNGPIAIDYLGEMLEGGKFRAICDPLAEYSVPVRLAQQSMNSIFSKFVDNLLSPPSDYQAGYKTVQKELICGDFAAKCARFDECIEDLTQEMVAMHQQLEELYHTATVLTDIKYNVLNNYLENGQRYDISAAEKEVLNKHKFIAMPLFSVVSYEFNFLELRTTQWPNSLYQRHALPRILGIKRINQRTIEELGSAFILLQEPYKQSLDDAVEFIFNLEQTINGQATFRKMAKIKQRETSESFYLSLNVDFTGNINKYYQNSEQKIQFIQSLFGKDIFVKQAQEGTESGSQVNGVKLARYSQFFVNFDQDFAELRASEHLTVRNKFKKINYTEFKFEFFNEQYLKDCDEFYNQQLAYYNIQNEEHFFHSPQLEPENADEFLEKHYKNAKYSTKTAAFKQFIQEFEENSQIFTTAVLDVDALLNFNYHRSNFAIPEDVCNLQEVNKAVEEECEQQAVRGSQLGLLNQVSTDVFSRINYSSQVLKRSSVFANSSVFDPEPKQGKNHFLNSTDVSHIEESDGFSSDTNYQKSYEFRLLNHFDFEKVGFSQKLGTFRTSHVNFNHYFYVAINICKFSNASHVLNRFATFCDQLANVFKISLQEIMRKIVESTYWAGVSMSTGKIYAHETDIFIKEVIKVIKGNRGLKSVSDYNAQKITHRDFHDILISNEMFEEERRNSVKLLKIINLRIQDTVIALAKFVCTNIIIPFVTQFVGIFYSEVFGCCVLAVLEAKAAEEKSKNRILIQTLRNADVYLDYFYQFAHLVFKPYKEIELISSQILHGEEYDGTDKSIVVKEAQIAEQQFVAILDDARDFIESFNTENTNIVASYNAFRAKYALELEGVSYQKLLEKIGMD